MKNTIENNILLAEFLGWKTDSKGRYITPFGEMDESGYLRYDYEKNNLQFDCDWNWLMLVFGKILISKVGKSDFDLQGGYNTETTYSFQIKVVSNFGLNVVSGHANDLLTTAYKCCIEFVKWYNDNK